ncbi:MAG TPA: alpha/beta hydrolase, partial [Pseudacidobacterium sp.]|nr:alpha/beta hydrolase [Pseudacidobacterium sp.]
MSQNSPKRKSSGPAAQRARAAGWKDPLQPQQPLVSGKWLFSALGIAIGAAAVCAYVAFCLLFYQGSWQLIFHPSRTITATPASVGIGFDDVRFDYTETGKPQLAGWWVPADANARYAGSTILLLRDGRGSLSDSIPQIQALHALGINVFAFDYRGFGRSADAHPSEKLMNQDADTAWSYLTDTHHIPGRSIVLYGIGLGSPVAVTAAVRHSETAAIVLENVSPNALTLFAADSRTKLLPVRLLASDRFDPVETLGHLRTPKLFLERGAGSPTEDLFHRSEFPKRLVQFAASDKTRYLEALQAFLD